MKLSCARLLSFAFGLFFILSVPRNAAAESYLFGISDDNKIHQVNLTNFVDAIVFDTGLTGLTNGVAWDEAAGRLYYRNPEGGNLYYWSPNTNVQSILSGEHLTGFNANAAVYNGAYWYVQDGTDILVQATFGLSGPYNVPVISVPTSFYNFDGLNLDSFLFGDIAISKAGVLYGSSNYGLFSVDISGPLPTGFKILSNSYGVRQITLDQTGSFIYGQDHATGNWYTANLNGVETPMYSAPGVPFSTTPLRDISELTVGDVVEETPTVPEPAAWQLLALGTACIGFTRLKRRKGGVRCSTSTPPPFLDF